MTTIQYSKEFDTFRIVNETRIANVTSTFLYSRMIDQDLLDCARQAIDCAGEVITVPSTSYAHGLRPRTANKYFVQ